MQQVYIVRSGSGSYEPESYILGLYPTQELADRRIQDLTSEDKGFDPEDIWTDLVEVGTDGTDCFLSNR
jgi:hypothetical protein